MKLHKLIQKNGKIDWKHSWKFTRPASIPNMIEANLRELYDDEVLLDYESKSEAEAGKKKLKKKGISYVAFDTGSRGEHIHIRIPRLKALGNKKRLFYREVMIEDFGSDPSKKSGFLAMEGKPHFKTGKTKTNIETWGDTNNNVDMNYLIEVNKRYEAANRIKQSIQSKDFEQDLIPVAKNLGFSQTGKQDSEVYGYFETSSGKKHFWINTKKNVFYDFHTSKGGGLITMIMTLKKTNVEGAVKWLNKQ